MQKFAANGIAGCYGSLLSFFSTRRAPSNVSAAAAAFGCKSILSAKREEKREMKKI